MRLIAFSAKKLGAAMTASTATLRDRPCRLRVRSDAGRRPDQALWRPARACRHFLFGECRRGARPHRAQRRRQDDAAGSDRRPPAGRRRSACSGAARPCRCARRRELIFYLPDGVRPWEDQYVARVLEFFAAVYGRSESSVAETIRALGLAPVLRKRVLALSKGYGRRLMLALALLTPHPLLLMDEPFDGFDLRQTREIMGVLRRRRGNGRTLVLAIHQLIDAERVCDRFVLLADGRVRGVGTLDELRARSREAVGRTGGRVPCAHLTPAVVRTRPLRSVARQGAAGSPERPRAVDDAAAPVPAGRLQLFPGGVALRRGKLGGARIAGARQRALAARRRAGADIRRALRRRHTAVSVRGDPRPRPRKGNRARCGCWSNCPIGSRR